SPRDPVRTKKPRAADRTEGIASVTTRRPELHSVTRCVGMALPAVRVAVAARAALPAVAPAAVAASVAAAAAAPAAHGRVAGADGGQLLGRLAGDLRVLGEAQAD